MTWAERVGDLGTRLALVILTAVQIVTVFLRFFFVLLDRFIVRLGEFAETGLQGAVAAERAWVRLPGSVFLGIIFLVLQFLAIFTVLFRQASTTLNDFIVGLAEGEERVVEAPPAPPQLPPSEPGA